MLLEKMCEMLIYNILSKKFKPWYLTLFTIIYAVMVHQPLDAVPYDNHHGHDNLGVRLDDHHDNNDLPGAGPSLPHHLHCLHHHCHRCRPQRCSPCHCHIDEMSEMSPKNVIFT